MRGVAAVVVMLCTMLVSTGAAQTIGTDDVRIRFTGRVQMQFSTSSIDAEEAGATNATPQSLFELRRVRPVVELTIREWITGMIEPDFGLGTVQLRNGWINLAFTDGFQLRAGQFKKPFARIQLESSLTMPMIERPVRIRGLAEALEHADEASGGAPILTLFQDGALVGEEQFVLDALGYHGFDLGAELNGEIGDLTWAAGVFNGAGANRRDDNDRKSATARVTYAHGALPLEFGAGVSYQERLYPGEQDGVAFEVDLEWGAFRREGVRVLAEVVTGGTMAADDRFVGAQGVVSWFRATDGARAEGFEPMARVSWADPRRDIDGDAGVLLTPGINLYFFGRNRLMLNWDVFMPEADRFETEHAVRAQAQLHFQD
jgi:hypothetical protein